MSQINDSLSNSGYLTTDDEDAGGCEGYIAPAAKLVFFYTYVCLKFFCYLVCVTFTGDSLMVESTEF